MYSYRWRTWQNECSPQKLVSIVKFSDAPFSDVVLNLSFETTKPDDCAFWNQRSSERFVFWCYYSWLGICMNRWNSATVVSHTINRSILSVKVSDKPVGERVKIFFILSRAWDKEKILSPHEELNLKSSDFALRYSTTETQRLRWARSIKKFTWHASRILLGSAMSIASYL